MKAIFQYTCEYEADAIRAIEKEISACKLKISNIKVIDSVRACRNAYGKKLSEEEFEAIDPASDEAWFDDYEFIILADVTSKRLSDEDIEKCLSKETSYISSFAA